MLNEIKQGDYLLTKENQLFRITEVYIDTKGTYYDIKSLRPIEIADLPSEVNIGYPGYKIPRIIRSVPRNVLRHMGKIIPEEKITKTLKILYG